MEAVCTIFESLTIPKTSKEGHFQSKQSSFWLPGIVLFFIYPNDSISSISVFHLRISGYLSGRLFWKSTNFEAFIGRQQSQMLGPSNNQRCRASNNQRSQDFFSRFNIDFIFWKFIFCKPKLHENSQVNFEMHLAYP